jgi:cytochrome o ubiquinol oxidase subunit IV
VIDANDSNGREERPAIRSYLWDIGFAVIFSLLSVVLTRVLRQQFTGVPETGRIRQDCSDDYKRDLHSYIWGISLALVLTFVPFALVYRSVMSRFSLYFIIGAFALVQIVVHFRFFLHVNPPKQKTDDLQLILFSSLILLLMGGGTIWIMANLAVRMMP